MVPPVSLPTRRLGNNGPQISAVGLGLMGLSLAYGTIGSDEERFAILDRAWELGCTNWDTSDMYGDSEELLGKWFRLHPERRADIFLASKFGIKGGVKEDGSVEFGVDTTPEYARQACERSLKRLGVDSVDLYYIHRLDPHTPVEKAMQVLAELKKEGKIKAIGMSECSSASVRRAYKIAPVDAVQVEYNPWQLDIENETGTNLLATCRELGITVFAYSPLGRGFLTGQIRSLADFEPEDFRRMIPRFSEENFPKNLQLVDKFQSMAAKKGCTSSQLALAWLMAQGEDIIPIPGTKKIKYLEENISALKIVLTSEEEGEIRAEIEKIEVAGHRSPAGFFNEYADTVAL
ncbi:NADP-dependent oxidoreductase domain-containing protein [Diplogelasinospora grovesii]|uniref:NADP-dependent oxidoreductase domain-containing protein n=1 Tax=Diplogelasinospora grovesii TaxID=303347 RepID=A0AAN6MZE7_9PEZI|nr:NADP-dependent oxidoreductase domain-containing protein [Diplogelasinospora grovesii]